MALNFRALLSICISSTLFCLHAMALANVCIYDGPGTSDIEDYIREFSEVLSTEYNIRRISSEEIIEGESFKDCKLLVMPGGADLPYCKALNGRGNENIRTYVENGGCFLGICAGAYYAAKYCIFDAKDPLYSIVGQRELQFFEGKAKGPVLKKYFYEEPMGIVGAKIFLNKFDSEPSFINQSPTLNKYTYVYYNGGPAFIEEETKAQGKCLAFFKKTSQEDWYDTSVLTKAVMDDHGDPIVPAIVFREIGEGKVVLSGVHLENTMFDHYLPKDPNFIHRRDVLRIVLERFLGLNLKIKHLIDL